MIIYCAGYKVRAELITLFPATDVEKLITARSMLMKSIAEETGSGPMREMATSIDHAHAIGMLGLYFSEAGAKRIGAHLSVLREVEGSMAGRGREFHWSDITGIESCHPHRFSSVVASTRPDSVADEVYVHDGGDYLELREGATGPRHKVRLSAIDMIEYGSRS